MKKSLLLAIVAAAILVPATVYAASPLFLSTTVDELLPKAAPDSGLVVKTTKQFSGTFVGIGDGIHNAQGTATVLYLEDKHAVLRLEDFKVTNGPDLHVYLTTDRSLSDFIDLGRLKANIGNQNYDLPSGIDLSKYDNVIVWCKSFSVYFGGAQLVAS